MEQKKRKPTNAQLEKRIKNAIVLVEKDKDTQSIYFSDKGLRLTATSDYAIIETGFHRHVFNAYNTAQGMSRPWIYTKRVIEIAAENDCTTKEGYSYARLFEVLKAKEDKTDYNIATFFDWYLFNVFQPLYSIGETEIETFLVYEAYLHNLARTSTILSEKTEDMTNLQFINNVCERIKEFCEGMNETVVFPKKTDEEIAQEEMAALSELESETTPDQ